MGDPSGQLLMTHDGGRVIRGAQAGGYVPPAVPRAGSHTENCITEGVARV